MNKNKTSSVWEQVVLDIRTHVHLISTGATQSEIDSYVKQKVEESAAQYFSMPDNVFNSGTGCQDSTTK